MKRSTTKLDKSLSLQMKEICVFGTIWSNNKNKEDKEQNKIYQRSIRTTWWIPPHGLRKIMQHLLMMNKWSTTTSKMKIQLKNLKKNKNLLLMFKKCLKTYQRSRGRNGNKSNIRSKSKNYSRDKMKSNKLSLSRRKCLIQYRKTIRIVLYFE